MFTRRIFSGFKSLLHFDFPHSEAENTALKDEVSQELWSRSGSAMFASKYFPADITDSIAPKFGYRSLYTQSESDYISASNSHGTFNLSSTGQKTIEIFICPKDSNPGRIIAFMNGNTEAFSISLTSSRTVKVSCSAWTLSLTGSQTAGLNSWTHVRVIISYGNVSLHINGVQDTAVTITSGQGLTVTGIRIGGAHALFDEFALKDFTTTAVINSPHQGSLDITKAGGFGTGRDGAVDTTSAALNPSAQINKADGANFTLKLFSPVWKLHDSYTVISPSVRPGDEVMFLVHAKSTATSYTDLAGLYAFRTVTGISESAFSVDRPVTEEFDMAEAVKHYDVFAYKIPHFSSFSFSGHLGHIRGVTAFRCTGDVNFSGVCGSVSSDRPYMADYELSHSDLPDRLIPTHNILIFCGGTFTAPSSAKIGNTSGVHPGGYAYDRASVFTGKNKIRRGCNILIAARRLRIDANALQYGAPSSAYYSGCCYLAGDIA